jgi:hypothetical protein
MELYTCMINRKLNPKYTTRGDIVMLGAINTSETIMPININ